MADIYFRNRKNGDLLIHSTESVCREYLHQLRVINRLSKKIQKKNNKIKELNLDIAAFQISEFYLNKDLKECEERINKALKYLDKIIFDEYGVMYDNGSSILEYEHDFKDNLLEILKGSDK